LLTTDSYPNAVLKAVNLGRDTDTTGAITGGLAGLYYGINNIPEKWLQQLARYEEIDDLAWRVAEKLGCR
jgi:ADP-ribosylglycohydrolase